ncbi:hypothetical protein H4R20_002874 [Coemansia guatemalensis]|uniref:Carbohydrate kinase PfkB domain-containing protein n=1 Tax=Coemansia guatemalensis TaxID=2761395 RepID=A0A9W8HUC5_9FUNG|nr:hypothetical protein H4R20_002874 [Coemansia guatemalensis]
MDINDMLSSDQVQEAITELIPDVVAIDGNMSIQVISTAITHASSCKAYVVYEPTSIPKCTKILSALALAEDKDKVGSMVHVVTPNQLELRRMAEFALQLGLVKDVPADDMVAAIHCHELDDSTIRDALTLFPLFPVLIIKLGEKGAAIVGPSQKDRAKPELCHIQALIPGSIINCNGAGDSLVGAMLAMLHKQNQLFSSEGNININATDIGDMVRRAQRASIASLESHRAISEKLAPELIE